MDKRPSVDGAPALRWKRLGNGIWVATWVARRDIVKRGYAPKTQRLWPPTAAPDAELTPDVIVYLRSECQRLQNDMLGWSHGGAIGVTRVFDGTLAALIDCYRTDEDSSFHDLRYASRRTYSAHLRAIDATIGDRRIASVTGRDFKRWFRNYADDGAHISRAHGRMTMLRILLQFGATILEDRECQRLRTVISDMEFANARPRESVLTADQAVAIRRRAHHLKFPSIALAQAIEFELMLRPKDVIGEWIPLSEPGLSDVTARGMKWLYGIDWREVSPDLILRHRLSKSLRGRSAVTNQHAGKFKEFDLRLYPMVMQELALTPATRRVGPMVINETTGLPYGSNTFRSRWRMIATECGVPPGVQNRDGRAGAITEGIKLSDGNVESVRHAAGHSQLSTTLRYSREGDRHTADIAKIRAKRPVDTQER